MQQPLRREWIIAISAGLTGALFVGMTAYIAGAVGELEARTQLASLAPTSRLLCSSVMTVTATILALMLTLLSFGSSLERELDDLHYRRVRVLAFCDSLVFGAATLLFLMHCIPTGESSNAPDWWFPAIYYVILTGASLLSGAVISIIALLYLAVRGMIGMLASDGEHRLVDDDS